MKRLFTFILLVSCFLVCVSCSPYEKEDHLVTQEEYERAFQIETLHNVTILMIGPYWERDGIKAYFYSDGDSFALLSYRNDVQFYGQYYGIENGEEFCYLYGNNSAEVTQEQLYWRKYGDPSAYSDKGVEFVALYKRSYPFLEYDEERQAYVLEMSVNYETSFYIYHFTNKKLSKFEIINNADNYHYIWEFYDYGMTKIPEEVGKN